MPLRGGGDFENERVWAWSLDAMIIVSIIVGCAEYYSISVGGVAA